MKIKTIYLILMGLLIYPVFSSVPLSKAIKNGINKSYVYKNSQLNREYIQLNRDIKEREKWFIVNLGAAYFYKSEKMELDPGLILPAVMVPPDSSPVPLGSRHTFDAKISLLTPIYRGNLLTSNVQSEDYRSRIAHNNQYLTISQITSNIKSTYFRYKLVNSRIQSLQSLLNNLKVHYSRLAAFYQEELVNKNSLLETRSSIEEKKLSLHDLQQERNHESIIFKTLCGYDPRQIEGSYVEEVRDPASALSYLKKNHPFLKNLDQRIQILRLHQKVIKGSYLPQINGFAELHYGKPGINLFHDEWSLYFQGGINLNLKLFDWNKKNKSCKLISYSIDKIDNDRRQFIEDSDKKLSLLYQKLDTLDKKLKNVESLISIAGEEIQLKSRLLKEEQISNTEYLSSLLKRDRYLSLKSSILIGRELLKVNINSIIGSYCREVK